MFAWLRLAALMVALAWGSAAAFAEKRVALVIGNNAYIHFDADHQLRKAVNDANAVGDALAKDHFEVIRGQNLSRSEMLDKIYELVGRLEPGDTALFYFAGHGVALGSGNYMLPSDVSVADGPAAARECGCGIAAARPCFRAVRVGPAGVKLAMTAEQTAAADPYR